MVMMKRKHERKITSALAASGKALRFVVKS